MKTFLTIFALATTFAAPKLNAQVPLTDPDVAQRADAERGYISAMKGDLRMLATAEEAYFSDKSGYFAGRVDAAHPLYGFSPSKNVSIVVTSPGNGGSMWTATATHSLTAAKCTFHLPDPMECTSGAPAAGAGHAAAAPARVTRLGAPDPVRIAVGQSKIWSFDVSPERSTCVVSGRIVGLDLLDAKVNVLVMSDAAYHDWRQGRNSQSYFESGERTTIPFDVHIIEPGRYVLVVANPSKGRTRVVGFEQTQVSCS